MKFIYTNIGIYMNMNALAICVLVITTTQKAAGISRLNESEYARLPTLFALEPFSSCLLAPGDTYCYVDAQLVANNTSQLLKTIQEYSSYHKTHFDHTLIHRGLCVTQTCVEYLTNSTDLAYTTEACLNASLYKSHGLQTKVIQDQVWCTTYGKWAGLDAADYVVVLLALNLLALNLAGSLYDFICHGADSRGARLLLCFSMRRNYRRLHMPAAEGSDAKQRQFKCLNGLKTVMTLFVVLGHSPLSCVLATNNPEYLEGVYSNVLFFIVLNGPLIIQTFFICSGFLMSYNMLFIGEKRRICWKILPTGIALRWLRLTPVYAVILAFVSTWQRHLGTGPLWKPVVEVETLQCRRFWYYNLLYMNNYVDNIDCMPQTWYLGADMQLSVLGLAIFCLATSAKAREVSVAIAFVVGLLTPAIHTYIQDLSPIVLMAPEVARNKFVADPTFNYLYKRGHTNMLCYAMGMALALAVYRLQQQNFGITKYMKYRPLYWLIIPLKVLVVMTGGVFYMDIYVPLAVRAVYASLIKLVYGGLTAALIAGAIFKLESLYRGWMEWNGWTLLGRLAYCVYLVHVTVIRATLGYSATLLHNSLSQIIMVYLGATCASFLIAVPLWVMVESPFAGVVDVFRNPRPQRQTLNMNTLNSSLTQNL